VRKRKEPNVGDSEASTAEFPRAEDHDLVRLFLRTGDPRAFQELLERHLPMIRRLLFTLLGGQREEMEDAEQEIMLSLFQGLREFQFRSSFRTYFYRLARNRGIDHLRRKRSRERTLARAKAGLWNLEPAGPEQQVLRQEEAESLLSFFRTLPAGDRELILMKDVDGFSIVEIAEVLGIPPGTVKSRLHRARAKLIEAAGGEP
jgi:RNA polymerase sigma-70 factor (ECF subfamily)